LPSEVNRQELLIYDARQADMPPSAIKSLRQAFNLLFKGGKSRFVFRVHQGILLCFRVLVILVL
jgi:hypothetical protein